MDRKEAIDYLQYIMKRFSEIGKDEKDWKIYLRKEAIVRSKK